MNAMQGDRPMTHHDRPDPLTTFDLPFDLAQARMADLRAAAAHPMTGSDGPGSITRLRDAVGRRLIALGSSLVVDKGERRHSALG
jgi:hypothetical protein